MVPPLHKRLHFSKEVPLPSLNFILHPIEDNAIFGWGGGGGGRINDGSGFLCYSYVFVSSKSFCVVRRLTGS